MPVSATATALVEVKTGLANFVLPRQVLSFLLLK